MLCYASFSVWHSWTLSRLQSPNVNTIYDSMRDAWQTRINTSIGPAIVTSTPDMTDECMYMQMRCTTSIRIPNNKQHHIMECSVCCIRLSGNKLVNIICVTCGTLRRSALQIFGKRIIIVTYRERIKFTVPWIIGRIFRCFVSIEFHLHSFLNSNHQFDSNCNDYLIYTIFFDPIK